MYFLKKNNRWHISKLIKKRKNLIISLFILICIFLLYFSIPIRIFIKDFSHNQNTLIKQLPWGEALNKQQSHNSCASYASMAYIFTKKNTIQDPETINKNISGKMKNNYTYPWGIVKYLQKHNLPVKIYYHGLSSDQNRKNWIKTKINKGIPVIILVWIWKKSYLHYITIVWYNENSFQVYDSLSKIDNNWSLAGNETRTEETLLKKWKAAKFKRIHLNLAITE